MRPVVVIRPTLSLQPSANQSAPSGPVVMELPWASAEGIAYSVTAPVVVMRPTRPPTYSANHSAPSGPVVMPVSPQGRVGTWYSVM